MTRSFMFADLILSWRHATHHKCLEQRVPRPQQITKWKTVGSSLEATNKKKLEL